MLSTRVLRMSSPIAMAIVNAPDNPGIRCKLSPVVEALCAASYTTFPYSHVDAVEQIAEVCNGSSEQHALMNEASERIANGVRNGLKQISSYVKPIVESLTNRLNGWGDGFMTDVVNEVHNEAHMTFVRMDCPMLSYSFYPTEVRNVNIDYSAVDAKSVANAMSLLSASMTPEKLSEILASSSSELQHLYGEVDLMELYSCFAENGSLYLGCKRFLGADIDRSEGRLDFTSVFNVKVPEVLALYTMAKCFIVNDDILPFVTGASLDEFRNRMKYVCSLIECTLVKYKELMKTLAPHQFRVIHQNLKQVQSTTADNGLLRGNMTVGYTEKLINQLEESQVCSLSQLALGWVIGRRNGKTFNGAIESINDIKESYDAYIAGLTKKSKERTTQVIGKIVNEVIREKQIYFAKLRNDVVATETQSLETISARLAPAIKEFITGFNEFVIEREIPVGNYVANSPLIVAITRAFGMVFAARILELATTAEPGLDDRGRRERLAEAVVETIVEVCTGVIK